MRRTRCVYACCRRCLAHEPPAPDTTHALATDRPPTDPPLNTCVPTYRSCSNGCTCNTTTLSGYVPYDQIVVFLEEVHPTPAPACRLSVALDPSSPPGSKIRISGVVVTADPGHIGGRVGEVRRPGRGRAAREGREQRARGRWRIAGSARRREWRAVRVG